MDSNGSRGWLNHDRSALVHTVKVIACGLVLLTLCLVFGRAAGAKLFLPLWLVAAAVNLWIGVARAGYSVADEAPVFLLVFGIPAAVALLALWQMSKG
jgi:hypothetical protein